MPLFQRPDGWWLLFTERAAHLRSHAGQISFPGGGIDPGDGGPIGAALREAHEEIGLDPADVRVLGVFDDFDTRFGARVTPVVGVVPAAYPYRPDPAEVASLIELPVRFFTAPSARRVEPIVIPDGTTRQIHFYDREPAPVWGITAGIVSGWIDAMASDPLLLETLSS